MRIEVTAEDIRNGRKHDCQYCPVARAIARATGKETLVGLRTCQIRSSSYTPWCWLILPFAVLEFIESFDAGALVQPFDFELDLAPWFRFELDRAPWSRRLGSAFRL